MPGLDRWLIDLATSNPPSGREDWARAMRAEFDALDGGRTGWAAGCLSAAIGWRMRAETSFILAATLIVYALVELPRFWFWLLVWGGEPVNKLERQIAYGFTWGPVAIASLILAALRPRYWLAVAFAVPLIDYLNSGIQGYLAFHLPVLSIFVFTGRLMDARVDVGMGAMIGYALMGGLAGRALNRAVSSRRRIAV